MVQSGGALSISSEVRFLWVTVPDDQIPTMAARAVTMAPNPGQLTVIHCSGATPSTVLRTASPDAGQVVSAHPLQAFAGDEHDLAQAKEAHWFLSGDTSGVNAVKSLLDGAGIQVHHLDDQERLAYHAAAVIASNGLVALAGWAQEVMPENNLAPLIPLMQGTLNNLRHKGVNRSLTGPIARGDLQVVNRHLEHLEQQHPKLVQPYLELSQALITHVQSSTKPLNQETVLSITEALKKPS